MLCNAYVNIVDGDIIKAKKFLRSALMVHPIESSHDNVIKIYVNNLDLFNKDIKESSVGKTSGEKEEKQENELFRHSLNVSSFKFYKAYEIVCTRKQLGLERIWAFIDFISAAGAFSIRSMIECFIKALCEIIHLIETTKDTITNNTLNGLFCVAKELLTAVSVYEVKYPSISASVSTSYKLLRIYGRLCDLIKPLLSKESLINAFETIHVVTCSSAKYTMKKFKTLTPLHNNEEFMHYSVHDSAYEGIILNEFTVNLLKYCENNSTEVINPIKAKYYLMEGCVNGWNDDDFNELRFSTMVAMLSSRSWDVKMVEDILCA
jgi:hypothetical protein